METKQYKKVIQHKEYWVFKETLTRNIKEGYEMIGKEVLSANGVWQALVSKTVKWDNKTPGKRINWHTS